MNADQRRQINRQNAQKSTGPRTPEGKERARRNALTHGLCASVLALPGEDPEALRAQHEQWVDHYQPEGPAELILVEEAARAALRLRRCARFEAAATGEQVRHARQGWAQRQEDRVAELRARLADDPEAAVRELKRFGHGCRWLLQRWRAQEGWLSHYGCLPSRELAVEAARLLGGHPDRLPQAPEAAYKVRLYNAVAHPTPTPTTSPGCSPTRRSTRTTAPARGTPPPRPRPPAPGSSRSSARRSRRSRPWSAPTTPSRRPTPSRPRPGRCWPTTRGSSVTRRRPIPNSSARSGS